MATTRDDVLALVSRSPIFGGMSRQEIGTVLDRFSEAVFLPGHGIVTEHMRGADFFIVIDGTAEVVVDDRPVHELRPGDFFGEVAALDGGERTATVRARTQVRCLTLPNGEFRQFLLDHPAIAVNLLPELVRRFRSAAEHAPGRS